MDGRGLDLIGFVGGDDDNPVALVRCDCGREVELTLSGTKAFTQTRGVWEFAFTCDDCLSQHWLTVAGVPPPQA